MSNLHDLRNPYDSKPFSLSEIDIDPIKQFSIWFDDVLKSDFLEPNAMAVSTVSDDGKPSSRMILLKSFDQNGFVFFTNYLSRKGKEIQKNNQATILFYWDKLHRQIRIEGVISKISETESDEYFYSRPLGSRIGAIASPQSEEMTRSELEQKIAEIKSSGNIKRPEHWGGYNLKPNYFEFWQGRENRLHDRIIYTLSENEKWETKVLAP